MGNLNAEIPAEFFVAHFYMQQQPSDYQSFCIRNAEMTRTMQSDTMHTLISW